MKYIVAILFCFLTPVLHAQEKPKIDQFFTPSDTLSKTRLIGVTGATLLTWTGMMVVLNDSWYSQYERETFHFYNDDDEWLQIDKVGHAWSSYQGGRAGIALLRWSGVENKKAQIYGAPLGFIFLTGIEILDGFSAGWGFSGGDMLANTLGVGLLLGQELAWDEQRIQFKYSLEPVNYLNDPVVQQRIENVYGTGIQKILKDYNAQTYWLSINPSSFLDEKSKFPKWLDVSVGYGADGMLGGRFNYWCSDTNIKPEDCPIGDRIDYSDQVKRVRQVYLSADIDLTKIKTNSEFLRTVLGTMNMIKIPAPALEYSDGSFHFRGLR